MVATENHTNTFNKHEYQAKTLHKTHRYNKFDEKKYIWQSEC